MQPLIDEDELTPRRARRQLIACTKQVEELQLEVLIHTKADSGDTLEQKDALTKKLDEAVRKRDALLAFSGGSGTSKGGLINAGYKRSVKRIGLGLLTVVLFFLGESHAAVRMPACSSPVTFSCKK